MLPDRRAVVDPGPPGESSWEALCDGVRAHLPLSDLEHVFVTHWHVDHAGLACRLADRADADLHLHGDDAPLVGDYAAARERRLERDARRMAEWDVPESLVAGLIDADSPSPLPETYPVTPLADGDSVAGVGLVHTPGHTLGHAAFVADGRAFVGDAVLPTYTPNVGGSDTRMDDPLAAYLDTLSRLESLADTVHPGHGSPLSLAPKLESIRAHHEQRARRVLAAVREPGEATPWAVARELFGELDGVHVKFGAGEAASHLTRLCRLGFVDRVGDDPVAYRAASDATPETILE